MAFDFQELELILGGLPVIDVEDWKNNTNYVGKFNAQHPVRQRRGACLLALAWSGCVLSANVVSVL